MADDKKAPDYSDDKDEEAPPPYTSNEPSHTTDSKHRDSTLSEDYHPPEDLPTRIFHIYRDPHAPFFSYRRYVFMAEDKTTIEYHVACHIRSPFSSHSSDVMVRRGGESGPLIGDVIIHTAFSTKIDCSTRPQPGQSGKLTQIPIRSSGMLTENLRADFGDLGGLFLWKRTMAGMDILSSGNWKLVEESTGTILAKFSKKTHKSIKKLGTLEMYGERIQDEDWLSAAITTLMAVVENKQRTQETAGGG